MVITMINLNRITDDLRDAYKYNVSLRDKVLLGIVTLMIVIHFAL